MDPERSDIILFKQIQANDRLALNTLFAQYYDKLCRFANTYLRHAAEAEEVVADVFVYLWKNRHQLTIEKNLNAYLYIAVKHAALAVLKKQQPLYEDIDDILLQTDFADSTTPEQSLVHKELQQHIDLAIGALPHRCKQVFMMSRFDNLTYREISKILDISENTVENHLVKALSHLRKALRQYQYPENHASALTEA
ncbi:RNA polymerase sigma-70 factor [Ohtaekwangia kribbensis]|uniref:RNA polymerase sigma-70 factor n=1 Tax=Ohtaekwangia kribbensis TaxID=688913 RepID=A0ABW3K871_9BACT